MRWIWAAEESVRGVNSMKCPECGHEMGRSAKCLRCGYKVKAIVPVDPEKIEHERDDEPVRKSIDPDSIRVSRASGGGLFGDLFGGGLFGGLFGDILGGFDIFGDMTDGYEYDPKYYDDFGNEIYLPDEFERESVEIENVEYLEEPDKTKRQEKTRYSDNSDNAEKHNTNRFRKHKRRRDDHN